MSQEILLNYESPSSLRHPLLQDAESGLINQFISFYSLPSSVISHPVHTSIKAGYLFYYVPRSREHLTQLVRDGLTLAKRNGFDLFNCLDLMWNKEFLETLKFGRGGMFRGRVTI